MWVRLRDSCAKLFIGLDDFIDPCIVLRDKQLDPSTCYMQLVLLLLYEADGVDGVTSAYGSTTNPNFEPLFTPFRCIDSNDLIDPYGPFTLDNTFDSKCFTYKKSLHYLTRLFGIARVLSIVYVFCFIK